MKAYLDCFPCFMRQALEAARMATTDVVRQREVLNQVAQFLPTVSLGATPVDIGQTVHRLVREVTRVADPYRAVKKRSNDIGLRLYPELTARVTAADDSLLAAIKIAGAGNIIDFGPKVAADPDEVERMIPEAFARALHDPIDMSEYRAFQDRLSAVDGVLYLGDNAGEVVCDKILIEQLVARGKAVTFVARGAPIINDATVDDARYVGLDKIATVISNGSDAPGTRLEDCSPEFREAFRSARFIISKGQGNFEGLSNVDAPIFFLFKAKCPVIAREAGVALGTVVLRQQALEKVMK